MFLLRLIFIALVPFVAEIMKKIFLLLLYVMISAGGIIEAQNVAVPVIVNRDSWDTEIEISTSCVQDTLRIVVTVVCRFDTDLYLKTRKAQLVQVSLDKVEFIGGRSIKAGKSVKTMMEAGVSGICVQRRS